MRLLKRLLSPKPMGFVLLLIVALLPQCVSIRMSDKKVRAYFAGKAVEPTFGFVREGNHRDAGRSLHYARIGVDTLPMVLFIHGSPGSWDAFISFFADSTLYQRAQLVAVDRPGFGKSNLGEVECSLRAQAAAIAPLLKRSQSAHKPILVGHSLGGPVAARLAMDYPRWIGGLILVAPSIDPDLEKKEWYRPLGNAFPIRYWLPPELRVSNQEILPLKGELQQMLPLWQTIRVPVTIIQGEEDNLVPAGNADFARRMLTHAPVRIVMVPKTNHFIPWRRPDLIHDAILQQLIIP